MKGYCHKCGAELTSNNASPSSITAASALCRVCDAGYRRDRYLKRNPNATPRLGTYRSKSSRLCRTVELHRFKKFGITQKQFDDSLSDQNNLCKICNRRMGGDTRGLKACQDHDHETGQLRDILCSRCNLLLGHVSEDIEILASAIRYLQKWTDNKSKTVVCSG